MGTRLSHCSQGSISNNPEKNFLKNLFVMGVGAAEDITKWVLFVLVLTEAREPPVLLKF